MNLRGHLVRLVEVQRNVAATRHAQSRRAFNVRLDERTCINGLGVACHAHRGAHKRDGLELVEVD